MNEKTIKAMLDYSNILREIEALEIEKEELKEVISKGMNKEGLDSVKSELGTFFFRSSKSWEYSEKIKALSEKLKKEKKEEEIKGIAVLTESKSLSFLPSKK